LIRVAVATDCLAPANERCGTFRVPFSTGSSSIFVHFPIMTSVLFAEGGEGKVEGSVSAWINPTFTHPVAVATGVESSSGEGQNVHRCTKVRPEAPVLDDVGRRPAGGRN